MPVNWRDPAEYPDPRSTRPARWAWEFLRRNPSYRADWERYAALPENMRAILDGFGLDPPAKEGETLLEYRRRVGDNFRVLPVTHASLAAKYGIFRMEDPSHADTVLSGREADQITTYGAYLRDIRHGLPDKTTANGELPPEKRYDLRLSAEEVCIKFNLSWPIVAQWKRFKPLLGVLQAHFKRQHPERSVSKRKRESHYRKYLQLLDGEEAGTSHDEMVAALYSYIPNHPRTM